MYDERKEKNLLSLKYVLLIVAILIVLIIIIVTILNLKNASVKYTITFDTNGGPTLDPVETSKGNYALPTDLEREGYVFYGWKVGDNLVRPNIDVKEDITLTASWGKIIPSKYIITYNMNGGEGAKTTVAEEGIMRFPEEVSKKGFAFNGWTINGAYVLGDYNLEGNITVDANWISPKAKTHKVTFQLTDDEAYTFLVLDGATIKRPIEPLRESYDFKGWYVGKAAFNFNNPITSDVSLQAKWGDENLKDYTVSFELSGATGTYKTQTLKSGSKIVRPEDPTREGYVFAGWKVAGKYFDFDTPIRKNQVLVAQWTQVNENTPNLTIIFSLGGDNGEYTVEEITSGGVIPIPEDPELDGSLFVGWGHDGEFFNFNTPVTKEIKLTARWIDE